MILFFSLAPVLFQSFLGNAHGHLQLGISELLAQGTQAGGKYRIADLGATEKAVCL